MLEPKNWIFWWVIAFIGGIFSYSFSFNFWNFIFLLFLILIFYFFSKNWKLLFLFLILFFWFFGWGRMNFWSQDLERFKGLRNYQEIKNKKFIIIDEPEIKKYH